MVLCATAVDLELKFCFLIDGLDEYEGKPNDMVELTRILRVLPNVKICVSSRDWNDFEAEFGGSKTQKLYMQDYNHNDIRKYVYDTFDSNPNYQEMEGWDTSGKALLDSIIKGANGVFLWVFLVVRSFEEGFINGDSFEDLQRILEQDLPEDLNKLFERVIFRDVPENYRGQSAQIFSMASQATENLSFMAYWFAGNADPQYAFKLEVKPVQTQILLKRKDTMRKRLNISCRGLLEIQDMMSNDEEDSLRSSSIFNLKVGFLHRTVRDFLLLEKTQKFLHQWISSTFDVHERICEALLAQVKITPNDAEYWGPVSQLYTTFNNHCDLIKLDAQKYSVSKLRESFNKVMLTLGYVRSQQRMRTDDDRAVSYGSVGSTCAQDDEGSLGLSGCNSKRVKSFSRVEKLFAKLRPTRCAVNITRQGRLELGKGQQRETALLILKPSCHFLPSPLQIRSDINSINIQRFNMVLPDPEILARAVSTHLAKAQKQADDHQDASRLQEQEQEIKSLKETITALEDHIAQVEARIASYDHTAVRRHEEDLKDLHETVTILVGRVDQSEAINAGFGDVSVKLDERICDLERDHQGRRADLQIFSFALLQTIYADSPTLELYRAQAQLSRPLAPPTLKETPEETVRRTALEAHFNATRRKYRMQRPGKDHRSFIWSFIEGIKDKESAQRIQEYLIKKFPGKIRRSKSPRNGRIMAMSMDLKWEEVRDAMLNMPPPS
ncbi:hypothetical protein VM1G_02743 [Cytospora mali]|uniref:DUF7791 domain-containing protein n=1 Tax=Cytospora mali TaxID=578113 RepID=A0A194VV83_CYTMA|nr:hypothetical protein VM1G_02743 [Valsa mali]